MRVVLDTNVLVSALLKPNSKPARILRMVLQGDVEPVISGPIVAEYREMLARPGFDLNQEDAGIILNYFEQAGIHAPALASSLQLPDPDDEPFLESAITTGADALITGNRRHFPPDACRGQPVVTPDEFLKLL